MANNETCPICGSINANFYATEDEAYKAVDCECCGRFESLVAPNESNAEITLDRNKFAIFLFYNGKISKPINDQRFFYSISNDAHFENLKNKYSWCRLLQSPEVEAWFPQSFSAKIDAVLLGLAKISNFDGDKIILPQEKLHSLFFVKRFNDDGSPVPMERRNAQYKYIAGFMQDQDYLTCIQEPLTTETVQYALTLKPKGLIRIDELQKTAADNKNVFVAVAPGKKTEPVRDAIKAVLENVGYTPLLLEDYDTNNQITPEMAYSLNQCKFVVADATENNGSVCFIAGYAEALGKEVVYMCKKLAYNKKGHFEVQQKAVLVWDKEEEIAASLNDRIEALII